MSPSPSIPAFHLVPFYPATSGLCVEGANGLSSVAGDGVNSERPCHNTAASDWGHNASNELVFSTTNLCITKAAGVNAPGTPLTLQTCTGATGQQWTRGSDQELVNTESATCMTVDPDSTSSSIQLTVYACSDTITQQFGGP